MFCFALFPFSLFLTFVSLLRFSPFNSSDYISFCSISKICKLLKNSFQFKFVINRHNESFTAVTINSSYYKQNNYKLFSLVYYLLCLVAMSCRHLQQIAQEKNHYYPDGVYKINPTGSQEVLAYCDMSRDGGGWTLLVTSHTNSWTENNVILRNSPKLYDDYSILKYADNIKDNLNVGGTKFEYRLEAQSRGNSLLI